MHSIFTAQVNSKTLLPVNLLQINNIYLSIKTSGLRHEHAQDKSFTCGLSYLNMTSYKFRHMLVINHHWPILSLHVVHTNKNHYLKDEFYIRYPSGR